MRKPKKAAGVWDSNAPCAIAGCDAPGEYKAPMPGEPGHYQYLCLEHVRKFNQAWDYFGGWSSDEIEGFMHSAAYGHRPTWSMRDRAGNTRNATTADLEEALARMTGEAPPRPRTPPMTREQRRLNDAFAVLELEPGAPLNEVKTRYKKLVKKYHPDVNEGKDAEDMFKRITAAYALIGKHYEP